MLIQQGRGGGAELRDRQAVSVKRKGTVIESVGMRKWEGQDRKLWSENWMHKFRISDVKNLEECKNILEVKITGGEQRYLKWKALVTLLGMTNSLTEYLLRF